MSLRFGNSQIKNVSGQSSIGSSNNYAVQPRKQNQKMNDIQHDPFAIQQSSRTNNGDLQTQVGELKLKYSSLEQNQTKMEQFLKQQQDSISLQMLELKTKYSSLEQNQTITEQFLKQQQDSISQLQKSKSELDNNPLNNQKISEIKKIVLNILEQNKMPQQQKLLQDLDKININISNHQSQIIDQKMQIEQLKQGCEGHKNLKDQNEHILKQFQQLKAQVNSQIQLQMIKIQDDLKQNLSQQNQQQQIIVQIEKELIILKNRIEQMSQQNQQNSLNIKEQLTKQNRQNMMSPENTQQNTRELASLNDLVKSKELGSSSNSINQLGNSIKELGGSGVQQNITSKLLKSAHQAAKQNPISGTTQVSKQQFPVQINHNSQIKQQVERERNLTNISNCSSLREATFICFLCNIQTNENYRQTSCGHVYHNNCYRKLQESQIQQQKGLVRCMCNQILAQCELLPDLKPNYYSMQVQLFYKKQPDLFQKCRNYQKCQQFWFKDKYNFSDICIECNQDKSSNLQKCGSFKSQSTQDNNSQFSQQSQPSKIIVQKANPQSQQQQKSNFTIDPKFIQNQRQPIFQQITTSNSKIRITGMTGMTG